MFTYSHHLLLVEEDWNVVMRECSSLCAHWENLSGFLGLSISLIDKIKADSYIGVNECWNEALKNWIKQNYKTSRFGLPSWRTLLEAIARVNKLLFKRLADCHKGIKRTFLFNIYSNIQSSDQPIMVASDLGDETRSVYTITTMYHVIIIIILLLLSLLCSCSS